MDFSLRLYIPQPQLLHFIAPTKARIKRNPSLIGILRRTIAPYLVLPMLILSDLCLLLWLLKAVFGRDGGCFGALFMGYKDQQQYHRQLEAIWVSLLKDLQCAGTGFLFLHNVSSSFLSWCFLSLFGILGKIPRACGTGWVDWLFGNGTELGTFLVSLNSSSSNLSSDCHGHVHRVLVFV